MPAPHTDLFSGTIAANLRIARRDVDDAALWQALETVALAEFVRDCDAGLNTWIGESGTALSSGQARRLALARVILRDPPLVILDEPLSGLDASTEQFIRSRLSAWLKGRTSVVLGHDWASLPDVERAFELRAGVLQAL
jgi:ATP-binding cassette subfamily C protein CydC